MLFIHLLFPGFLFTGNLLLTVLCGKRSTTTQQVPNKCVQPNDGTKFAVLDSTAQVKLHCTSMHR